MCYFDTKLSLVNKTVAVNETPSHSYGVSLVMRSHSVTCHPTQVSTPRLNPSQTGWYSIYLTRRDGRLSWPRWLVTYRDGLIIMMMMMVGTWRRCDCSL